MVVAAMPVIGVRGGFGLVAVRIVLDARGAVTRALRRPARRCRRS